MREINRGNKDEHLLTRTESVFPKDRKMTGQQKIGGAMLFFSVEEFLRDLNSHCVRMEMLLFQ